MVCPFIIYRIFIVILYNIYELIHFIQKGVKVSMTRIFSLREYLAYHIYKPIPIEEIFLLCWLRCQLSKCVHFGYQIVFSMSKNDQRGLARRFNQKMQKKKTNKNKNKHSCHRHFKILSVWSWIWCFLHHIKMLLKEHMISWPGIIDHRIGKEAARKTWITCQATTIIPQFSTITQSREVQWQPSFMI